MPHIIRLLRSSAPGCNIQDTIEAPEYHYTSCNSASHISLSPNTHVTTFFSLNQLNYRSSNGAPGKSSSNTTQATAASNTLRNSNCVPTQHSRRQPNPLQHRNSLQCEEAVRRQFESVVRQESHEQKELLFYYCEIDCGVSNEKLFILEEGVVGGRRLLSTPI